MSRPRVLKGDLSPEIAAEFAACSELAGDCEMMGLNPWRDRLCVVQIMAEKGTVVLVQVDEAAGAPDRHGLKEVVREMAGEVIDKTNQSSDWGRDELTSDQIYYAADDVRYLFEVKRKLHAILEREGRLDLAERCFDFLRTRRDLDLGGFGMIFEH